MQPPAAGISINPFLRQQQQHAMGALGSGGLPGAAMVANNPFCNALNMLMPPLAPPAAGPVTVNPPLMPPQDVPGSLLGTGAALPSPACPPPNVGLPPPPASLMQSFSMPHPASLGAPPFGCGSPEANANLLRAAAAFFPSAGGGPPPVLTAGGAAGHPHGGPAGMSTGLQPTFVGGNPSDHAVQQQAQRTHKHSTAADNDSSSSSSRTATVYIGNINRHVDNDFMRVILGECGRVIRWNRQADPTTGQLAAFGFCDFQDPLGALNALQVLSNLELGGKALRVNCNEKVRAEVNRVREDRIISTLHTFPQKTREEVEADISMEEERIRLTILEFIKPRGAQFLADDGDEEESSTSSSEQQKKEKEKQIKKGESAAAALQKKESTSKTAGPSKSSNSQNDSQSKSSTARHSSSSTTTGEKSHSREGSHSSGSSDSSERKGSETHAATTTMKKGGSGSSSGGDEPAAPPPATAPPGPPGKDGSNNASNPMAVAAAVGGIGTFAGLSTLKALDPEMAAAASECSVYRLGFDGIDRRSYISEDYRPSRRELERLHHLERRDAEFDREFKRQEAEWMAREIELERNRAEEIAAEQEVTEEDRQQLIEEDLRGEWWEGLQCPRRRQERKRRRRHEAADDDYDREEEERELREQERAKKDSTQEKLTVEKDRAAGLAAVSQPQQTELGLEKNGEGETPDAYNRGSSRRRKERSSDTALAASTTATSETSSGSSSSSNKRRVVTAADTAAEEPPVTTAAVAVAAPQASATGTRSTAEKNDSRKEGVKKTIKTELRSSSAASAAAAAAAAASQELLTFFGETAAVGKEKSHTDVERKHKPLTKLEEHRDVTNKMQRAKETMKVIETSRKILALVPTEKEKLFAYPIRWSLLLARNTLETKLRPWVRKKVCEFMGAEEHLVLEVIDYIVKRVSESPPPTELLTELSKFLDEEAEGFVCNMWRLLIFEQLKAEQEADNSSSDLSFNPS